MTDLERRRRIAEVCDAALAREAAERAAFIADACGADESLRLEVAAVLAHESRAEGFLASPIGNVVARILGEAPRALLVGSTVGPYEIVSSLDAGGMGEVYRARDTKLGRDVAVKVLPHLFTSDPDRIGRFEREACVLASLNHPNIATIHGFEESDGIRALVMEFVEGETLAERIRRGGLPGSSALALARQIADALAVAHEQGIVHRDLKPANIMVRPDGTVKVLDFGLAKIISRTAAERKQSPPVSASVTGEGTVFGTAAYMSPEQVRGQAVDKRTDIWAFGCVLYEMLTGRPAFVRDTISDTMAGVLEREPDWAALPAATPAAVRRLLHRCLDKDQKRRLRDIGDAVNEIEDVLRTPERGARFEIDEAAVARPTGAESRVPRRHVVRMLALGIAIGVLAAGTVFWLRTPSEGVALAPVNRLLVTVTPAEQLGGTEGRPTRPVLAISPDGRSLVFSALRANRRSLYLRRFDAGEAIAIPSTDGAESPFFSPDGRWIGYWAAGEIRKVPLSGGSSVRVTDASRLFGASWGDDDRIVFSRTTSGLWEVPATGGTPVPLTRLDKDRGELSHRLPYVLPGGDEVLYTVMKHRLPRWDQTQVFVYSRRSRGSKLLIDGGGDGRYAPTGHILYVKEGVLLATAFDRQSLEVRGGPVGVLADVMQSAYFRGITDDTGTAQFSLSATGTLVYLPGGVFRPTDRSVVSVDRSGRSKPLPIAPRPFVTLRLSPDGQQIALSTSGRDRDIWVYTPDRGTLTKLMVPGRNTAPIWTRDSERITYAAGAGGPDYLSWVHANGSGSPERLVQRDQILIPAVWVPNAQELLYYRFPEDVLWSATWTTASDAPWIWVHDLSSKNSQVAVGGTLANAGGVDVSPDGRWIAYHSDESGRPQVYVQAYPGPAPRYQISPDGGISPIWRADGRELFYVRTDAPLPLGTVDAHIMTVPVRLQPTFNVGRATELFAGRYEMNHPARGYDVSGDGQRFLLIQSNERPPDVITQITVVQNWFQELTRLVPVQ